MTTKIHEEPLVILDRDNVASHVGREVAVSPWLPVTQAMIDAFADITGDRQWIHVDVARATAESPFGGTIAHGFLTMSLVATLAESCIGWSGFRTGINYGFDRLRFTGPVRAGARIRGRFTLASLEPLPAKGGQTEGVQTLWSVVVEVEGETRPAIVAEWLGRRHV